MFEGRLDRHPTREGSLLHQSTALVEARTKGNCCGEDGSGSGSKGPWVRRIVDMDRDFPTMGRY